MGSSPSRFTNLSRRILVKWSAPLTVLLAVLAVCGFYLGSKIQLKLSLTDLLPDNYPAVVKFNELTEVVGGVGFFTIVLHAEDGKSHLQAAPKVIAELTKNPLVRNGAYHREQRFFVDRMLYYLEVPKLRELQTNIASEIKQSKRKAFDIGLWDEEPETKEPQKPVFGDDFKKMAQDSANTSQFLTSQDGKHALVMLKPSFDSMELAKTRELAAAASEVLAKVLPPSVTYDFGERYYNKIVETDMIQQDIYFLGALSLVLIAVCLFLSIRSLRGLLIIFVPVFMGLGIMTGLTYVVIGHINIVTGFLMGIVSGLGVDYGIHMLMRLRLERREPSSEDPDPIWRTLASSGHAVFTGALAASFAFYLLCFSDFRAFSEFGFICGTGIAAVFLCLIVSFHTFARIFKEDKSKLSDKKNPRFVFPVLPLPKGLAVGTVVTVGLLVAALNIGFEYDFEQMMRHSKKVEDIAHLVDDIYGRSSVPAAVWTDSKQAGQEIEKVVKDQYMPGVVSEIISGISIVPENQEEKKAILTQIRQDLVGIKDKWVQDSLGVSATAVRNWASAEPFTFKDIPEHLQDALRGTRQTGYLMYLYPAVKLNQAQGVHTFAAMIRDLEKRFPEILTGSDSVIFSDILNLIKKDGTKILLVIFLSVGFFIWINTRRLDDTLLSYLPLLLALPVGMGLMALFGIKFNILNISIIPSFVALGIDVPIHIVHRTRETGSGYKAVRDLAGSINLALLTAGVGFAVLIFARAGVLKSLGWIALLGTLAIWWVGMFILPAFLEWSIRRRASRRAEITVDEELHTEGRTV